MRTVCLPSWGNWGLRARGIFTKRLSLLSIISIPHLFPVLMPRTRKPQLPQASRVAAGGVEQGKANATARKSDILSGSLIARCRISRAYSAPLASIPQGSFPADRAVRAW